MKYDAKRFLDLSEEELINLSDEEFLIYAWHEEGVEVIRVINRQKTVPMTKSEFLSHCHSCGGNWAAMHLSGINALYPEVYQAIPDDSRAIVWRCLGAVLSLLKISDKYEKISPKKQRNKKYDTYEYLNHVQEPDWYELKETEKEFADEKLSTALNDVYDYDADSSFSKIGELPDALFDFTRTQSGKKRRSIMNNTTGVDFDALALSKRTQGLLEKNGIDSVETLIKKSRQDLRDTKIFGVKSIEDITASLLKYNLHLDGDEIYECAECGKKFCDIINNSSKHYCPQCSAKMERVEQISDITITLSKPEYGSYTNTASGFTLYANITNNTDKPQKIKLTDFYIFTDGQQKAPEAFLTGYVFNEETVFPMTSRSCGKIWSARTVSRTSLISGDYSLITVVMNGTRYMFKFVYDGDNWRIDDYFEE